MNPYLNNRLCHFSICCWYKCVNSVTLIKNTSSSSNFARHIRSCLCHICLTCVTFNTPNLPLPRSKKKTSFIQKLQLKQCKHCLLIRTYVYRYKLSKEIVPSSGRLSLIFHFHLCMTESDPPLQYSHSFVILCTLRSYTSSSSLT